MEYQSNLLLKDTTLRLRTYSGESVKIMGFCYVTVQYYGKSKELPIYVTKNEGKTIVGVNPSGLALSSVGNKRHHSSLGRCFE